MNPRIVQKTLSANDAGETGGHQAGILIPKDQSLLSFFPQLNESELNPRSHIEFTDATDTLWEFAFIYYNNIRFGGTRNEYRLTRMTRYIRENGLASGDHIVLLRDQNSSYSIRHEYAKSTTPLTPHAALSLSSGWSVIDI